LKRYCKKHELQLYAISAVTGKGIEELKYAMSERVEQARKYHSTTMETKGDAL
jgi:50S ribosomal subunit-associated GTPase HflX